jgi:probable rRNA maturation factor
MNITTDVEDPRWATLREVEALVEDVVAAVLPDDPRNLDVLLTGDAEIRVLNMQWRGIDKATNILSFPSPGMPLPKGEVAHLGNLVLAWDTIEREAAAAQKPLIDHVVHLLVHGMLHLLGFDHEVDAEGDKMEAKETEILAKLGLADPYAT